MIIDSLICWWLDELWFPEIVEYVDEIFWSNYLDFFAFNGDQL